MQAKLPLILVALLLAGCSSASEVAPAAAPSTPAEPAAEPQPLLDTSHDPPPPIEVPIALDGNVGTSAVVCVAPAAQCAFRELEPGTSGIVFGDLRGQVLAGSIVISWTPSSPATQELAAGFMVMDGGEGCEGLELAGAIGSSPLTLAFAPMGRALCEGETPHLWVSGTRYGDAGGEAFYQVDVDQAFRAEGAFALQPPGPMH